MTDYSGYHMRILKKVPEYIVRDDFTDTRTAGNVDGTSATPIGGTRTVVDTTSKASVGSGVLNFTTPGVAIGNPGIWYSSFSRTAGIFILGSISSSSTFYFGFDSNQAGVVIEGFRENYGALQGYNAGTTISLANISLGETYLYASVLRTSGMYYFIKGSSFENWTLLGMTGDGVNATLYPSLVTASTTDEINCSFIRVPTELWLPAPIAYDSFGRANGTLGYTENTSPDGITITPKLWTGATWSISSNKAINTPATGNELFTTANASSDPYGNETDGITGLGTPTGATLISTNLTPYSGAYCNKLTSTLANGYTIMSKTIGADNWGMWKIWAKRGAQGTMQRVAVGTYSAYVTSGFTTEWQEVILGGNSTDPAPQITVYSSDNGNAGDELYFDNISVKQLTSADLFSSITTSSTDVVASVNLTFSNTLYRTPCGIAVNMDSANPSNYIVATYNQGYVVLKKLVGGVTTNLISTSASYVAGAAFQIITYHSDANTLKVRLYYNTNLIGTEQTITDVGIISNTMHGLFSTYSGNTLDNFTLFPRGSDGEYEYLDTFIK